MARKPDLEKDKILVVQGGSLPGQHRDPTRLRKSASDGVESSTTPTAWAEAWGHPEPGKTLYPHRFRIAMVIDIGTIDELVEQFRERLTRAVKGMLSTEKTPFDVAEEDPTPMKSWEANEKFQDRVQKLEAEGRLMREEDNLLHANWMYGLPPD